MSFLFINALNSSPTSFSLTFSFTTEKCFSRLFSTTAKIIFPTRSASFFFFCFQFTYLFLVPLRPFVLHMTLCHECKAKNYAYERQIRRFSYAYALILRVPTPFISFNSPPSPAQRRLFNQNVRKKGEKEPSDNAWLNIF